LYRGYPVEQLAEHSSYLEVADLLINGVLPTKAKHKVFRDSITRHTMVNERLLRFFRGFHHDAHPMAMVSAMVASMAAFYYDPPISTILTRGDLCPSHHSQTADHRSCGLQALPGSAFYLSA